MDIHVIFLEDKGFTNEGLFQNLKRSNIYKFFLRESPIRLILGPGLGGPLLRLKSLEHPLSAGHRLKSFLMREKNLKRSTFGTREPDRTSFG